MRCAKARKLISEYVDHLLDGNTEQMLLTHLDQCADCRGIHEEFTLIVNDTKQLHQVGPSGDLWPAIRNHMAREKRKTDFSYTWKHLRTGFFQFPVRQAFSFATVLLVAGVISLFYFNSPVSLMTAGYEDLPESIALTHFKEAENHYQKAIDALNEVVEDQGSTLPPEFIAVFKQNIKIIDESIENCRMAIHEHPEDIEANNYLLICYKKKMDLLNDMRELILRSS